DFFVEILRLCNAFIHKVNRSEFLVFPAGRVNPGRIHQAPPLVLVLEVDVLEGTSCRLASTSSQLWPASVLCHRWPLRHFPVILVDDTEPVLSVRLIRQQLERTRCIGKYRRYVLPCIADDHRRWRMARHAAAHTL